VKAVVTAPDRPGHLVSVEADPPGSAPGIAVVRVAAASINRGELRLIAARPNGWAPGQDIAGVVETAAPDGGPPAGTRVVGLADGGGWSELVPVPVERLAPLPDGVSFVSAAALPVAGLTALRSLRAVGDILGRELLVTGVSGGTGHFAARLALLGGARVTGLARRQVSIDGVRVVPTLGADERFDRVIDAVGAVGKIVLVREPA
jgi:NADPH2:quinone reductase